MKDRYRIVPPGGGEPFQLEEEVGVSVAELYADVAERLGCAADQISVMLRNHPGSALPFFHLRPADDVMLRRSAPPGSVLVVELLGGSQGIGAEAAALPATGMAEERPPSEQRRAEARPEERPPSEQRRTEQRPEAQRGLTGLSNMGNTCYLSSALQCLSQTQPLAGQLREFDGGGRVATASANLLRSLWTPIDGAGPVAPRELKAAIVERAQIFQGSSQQDAQELLQVLFEALHEDLRRGVPGAGTSESAGAPQPAQAAAQTAVPQADSLWQRAQETDASPISDLLQGQLRSTARCMECGNTEDTFELFWSLPLPVPLPPATGVSQSSLGEVMEAFCAEEALDEAWKCERCGCHKPGKKSLRLWRLPRVLQLHLKRFSWRNPGASQPAARRVPQVGGDDAAAAGQVSSAVASPAKDIAEMSAALPAAAPPEPAPVVPAAVEAPAAGMAEAPVAGLAEAAPGASSVQPNVEAPFTEKPVAANGQEAIRVAVEIPVEGAPYKIADVVPWDEQERMYVLVMQMLKKIVDAPGEQKFRSVGKNSGKLRRDLLDLPGGASLLQWAGFRDAGDRFDASALAEQEAESRRAELTAHAEKLHMKHLRRIRDERIELERLRRLPTGDSKPIRRWGGMLPSFGRGAVATYGLECTKIETCISLQRDPKRRRGLAPLLLRDFLGPGSPGEEASAAYELSAVVQHLGHSPFSGHYVAACWHEPSQAWWKFNDAQVTRIAPDKLLDEVFTSGAYVLFLELT